MAILLNVKQVKIVAEDAFTQVIQRKKRKIFLRLKSQISHQKIKKFQKLLD
jgi:hypothetical protein